jgi:hypothetical protein
MRYSAFVLLCFTLFLTQACASNPRKQYDHYYESKGLQDDAVAILGPKISHSQDIHPELKNDPIFAAWLKHQDRLISKLWQKPFKKPVICRISVNHSGRLTKIAIEQPSGSDVDERAAVDLLRSIPQFNALPTTSDSEDFLVKFTNFPNATVDRVIAQK